MSAGTGQATVLGDALQALESVAVEAGVPADVARAEGAALAAAVSESATGAAGDWAAATGGGKVTRLRWLPQFGQARGFVTRLMTKYRSAVSNAATITSTTCILK